MVSNPEIERFLANPENFLYACEWPEGQFRFVPAGRRALSEMAFLDMRTLGQSQRQGTLPIEKVVGLSAVHENKPDFIFHTAFCCSTMLTRCLEKPGKVLGLKEPLAVLGLSGFYRSGPDMAYQGDFQTLSKATLALLARSFSPGERTLIKPSNGANNILPALLGQEQTGRVLLLYCPLEDFLVSVINGGAERQQFIDGILQIFMADFGTEVAIPPLNNLSPLTRAALVWGLQMRLFEKAANARGPERCASLNSKIFLADKEGVLSGLDTFFGYGLGAEAIQETLQSSAALGHAKDPRQAFDYNAQAKQVEKTQFENAGEIEKARAALAEIGFSPDITLPNAIR